MIIIQLVYIINWNQIGYGPKQELNKQLVARFSVYTALPTK
jgi:hypothetical protein